MIDRLAGIVDRVLRSVLIFLMSLMVAAVTWQVVTRYLLSAPSSYTAEASTFLLIWISLLGSAHALRLRAHLGIDLLSRRLPAAANDYARMISYLGVIVFSGLVLVYGGSRLVYVTLALNQLSAALKVPMGFVYLAIPLSGVLIILYSLAALFARESSRAPDRKADRDAVVAVT